MAKADNGSGQIVDLIERGRTHGCGISFDQNRHGQWRISKITDGEEVELIADSDLDTACRLAIDELDRIADGASEADLGESTSLSAERSNGRALAAPQQLASPRL